MILKGSQRGGAAQLATHLLRRDENDFVELHEVKGFVADDLVGAFREAYAISKGTKCQQFLFSLSLSPPATAEVPVAVFEKAIGEIEAKLGLKDQPRVIVFHEKQGRRHAHCVWSRIDVGTMKAVNLQHFKLKLRDVSRDLYIEHGWHMPAGLARSADRDPRNVTREEWQQAKRAEKDPRQLKELFQDCWAISDSGKAFAQALESRGMYLARGDRRGFVAIDTAGEVYSIPKWTGLKTKVIVARLGDPAALRSVEQINAHIADLLKGMLGRHLAEARKAHEAQRLPLIDRKAKLRRLQREKRAQLRLKQEQRAAAEAHQRAARIRVGLRGLWDRITGRHAWIARRNEDEARMAMVRYEQEQQALVQSQLRDRQALHVEITRLNSLQTAEIEMLHREMAGAGSGAKLAIEDAAVRPTGPATSAYRSEFL